MVARFTRTYDDGLEQVVVPGATEACSWIAMPVEQRRRPGQFVIRLPSSSFLDSDQPMIHAKYAPETRSSAMTTSAWPAVTLMSRPRRATKCL